MDTEADMAEACPTGRWSVAAADDGTVSALASALGVSPTVARILVVRGISEPSDARCFLSPDLARDWADPSLIPGMEAAASRLADAIRSGSDIVVFGDFDLDGISSAAVAARGISALGGSVRAIVPNRFKDGYGLTPRSIERLVRMQPGLVVTVDCGISSAAEVADLVARGIDVVVTDHHEPGALIPEGIPVANPKLDVSCGSCDLAGAGVALKLIQAAGEMMGNPDVWLDLIDIAMLGTIADIVPLRGENRALVAEGLIRLRNHPRVSIAALATVAGARLESMTSEDVAFQLAPRMNAAGRMADPEVALGLLMTDDPSIAEELAQALDEHNRVRQAVEHDLSEAALALAEREFRPTDRALVLAGEGWHEGVKGIVASRLAGLYGVPALLFAIEGDEARGSGRTAGSVDLYAAVSGVSDMLLRYGGHEAAVGLTVKASDVPVFRERFLAEMATLPESEFETGRVCDAEIELERLDIELINEISRLEPFGHANPRPLFSARGVFMNGRQRVGRTANHLRFTAYDGVASVGAIAFRCRDIERLAGHESAVDLAFEITADEWRGRRRVQLMVRDIEVRDGGAYAPAAELVEDLFEHADEIVAREEYAGIADAESFHTKLVGVTFEGRQTFVARLEPGLPLRAERQPDNPHDPNAIAVFDGNGDQVGFFNRRLAAVLARAIDAGVTYDIEVSDVTGDDDQSRGVNVLVCRHGEQTDVDAEEERVARRQELVGLAPVALEEELVRAFIGDRVLHEAQASSLAALEAGQRCLTVMATGRGKSLIFHLHAARRALRDDRASVFVYPLRALVSDQAFHLEDAFAGLGLCVRVLTGESSSTQRDDTFQGLREGWIDVVLTTPEFLVHHAGRFAETDRVDFVVVDEAHHVGMSRAGHRPAYARLGEALATLGRPDVLAVTATAGQETASAIRATLGIDVVVADPTVRENLIIDDRRGSTDKDAFLAALVSQGEKCVVYVNSREQSVRLARMLRKKVPGSAMRVAFYNGGLSRAARHAVERAFRSGELDAVVATSAFGEGINIPDVRHVVLYHLPFNEIEFNQMCGRAGRDGAPARVHPLFGARDGRINEMILGSAAPSRDDLAVLYVVLRELQTKADGSFEITNVELAEYVKAKKKNTDLNERGVSAAIGVFKELGLLHADGYGVYRRLSLLPRPSSKLNLADSVRYAEGMEEVAEFEQFREWVLNAPAEELLKRFNSPILPSA